MSLPRTNIPCRVPLTSRKRFSQMPACYEALYSADERAPGSAWLPPPCSLSERVPQVSPEQFVESAPAAAERGAVGRRPGA